METKEIEQRIANAVNEIPIKEILQESKDNLKIKLERYEKNKPSFYSRQRRRIQAYYLHKAKNTKEKCIDFGIECILAGILIMLGVLIYQFIIRPLFS